MGGRFSLALLTHRAHVNTHDVELSCGEGLMADCVYFGNISWNNYVHSDKLMHWRSDRNTAAESMRPNAENEEFSD